MSGKSNNIPFIHGGVVNIANLEVELNKPVRHSSEIYASHASDRLLHASTIVGGDGFIGLDISTSHDCYRVAFFSNRELKTDVNDVNWILDECATADTVVNESLRSLYEDKRKVYSLLLRSDKDPSENCKLSVEVKESFKELIELMISNDVIVRIAAGSYQSDGTRWETILISLPHDLTLKTRTLISMAFPKHALREITDFHSQFETGQHRVGLVIEQYLTSLWLFLMGYEMELSYTKNRLELKETKVDDEDISVGLTQFLDDWIMKECSSDDIRIEELDLSVRTFNCFKRAGINTVGEIRKLSDDDLKQIRNFGMKSICEIKRVLAELEKREESSRLVLSEESIKDNKVQLEELIGLYEVKQQVRKITAFAKMKQDMIDQGKDSVPMVLNMEFTGNPGTAKTTVARILTGILFDEGLISNREMLEVGRADLVAKYTGQTADQVKEVFRNAKGRVLFIDEAYSLVDAWDNSYGDEAIATIVQEMENNRDDTIVIFAGYPDKMRAFFSRNPGLRSRVPFSIHFRDYSSDELLQIVDLEVHKRGFTIDEEARSKIVSACEDIAGIPDRGNGRFCRNLVEKAILNYAARVYGDDEKTVPNVKNYLLLSDDFELPSFPKAVKHRPIGFTV